MAVDMFIKIGDIEGESADKVHAKEIDVLAWSWGMSQSGNMHQGGGGGAGKVSVQDLSLTKYIDKGTVVYTSQGEIVGNEDYKELRVSVNATERKVQILSGYDEQVVREQSFPNTQAAFSNFMYSLANAGFSRERSSNKPDPRGVCPLGIRYIYQLHADNKEVVDLWTTSCGTKDTTFGGDQSTVRALFENQIPGFNGFVAGTPL